MVKVKCPVCGIEGFLEKHGKGYRIKHYKGYVDRKRLYEIHKVPNSPLNDSNPIKLGINLGIKTFKSTFSNENKWARSSAWLERQAHNLLVGRSNRPGPTNETLSVLLCDIKQERMLLKSRSLVMLSER